MRALLLLLACLPGCAVEIPAVPMQQFVSGDLAGVRAFAENYAKTGPVENEALVLNVEAHCELLMGRIDEASRHFETAGRIMGNWQTGGGETFRAVMGSEGSKTWKGDPYEKAMNAFYTGLTYLWRREPDNARAAFKKGILADAEV